MFRSLSKYLPLLMALLVLGTVSAAAQNGQISGLVTDPQGKAISGAAVQVVNQGGYPPARYQDRRHRRVFST